MNEYDLQLTLLSDTTFGRGDGVAGMLDVEVQHDAVGLPYLGGRALKGLLRAECDNILYALSRAIPNDFGRWQVAAVRLFGQSGARLAGAALLHIGPACLPRDLHTILGRDIENGTLTRLAVLEMLTTVRRHTTLDETGMPHKEAFRTLRVILRNTVFTSRLIFTTPPTADDLALLAATVKALRRVGTDRNRGHGRVQAALLDAAGEVITERHFADFRKAVQA